MKVIFPGNAVCSLFLTSLCIRTRGKGLSWRYRNVHPEGRASLRRCSHGYFHPIDILNSRHITLQDNNNSLHPHSHSRSIVCLWRPTISHFSHVRQLILLSLRLLDSALGVWICRRAVAGGTMLSLCPTLLIKPIHKSKMLPTATSSDNEGLSAATAAQTLSRQHKFDVFCVYTSHGSRVIICN